MKNMLYLEIYGSIEVIAQSVTTCPLRIQT